ncbi:MAG TPA: hypothetical protein VG367_06400 [Mucilaginibacter sp.]|jgi:hypothetical protein|nr:hypothetical protein [Mucilaginibacter sp.]
MKQYLFTILLFFAGSAVYAQSVAFGDLLNLTSMTGVQEHDLLLAKGFKAAGTQTFDGKAFEVFSKIIKGTPDKTETVSLGPGIKTASGVLTHQIVYYTQQESDLNNLLAEAKKSNMSLVFQGTDATGNIYRFDNSLFRASISLAFDKKSGNVDVQQK